jgi:uncharacterized protein (DUF4213/DUF364 family)
MCAEMRIIMIGIIGAMDEEVAKIVEAMEIELYTNRQTYINAMSESKESHAIPIIMNLINSTAK